MFKLGLYEKAMPNHLTIKEKLELCKKTNYDFLELSIDESDEKLERLNYEKEKIIQIAKDSLKIGLPIGNICFSGQRKFPLGTKDKNLEIKSLDLMKKCIDFASIVGARIIQLPGYDVYYETSDKETTEIFIKNLKKSVNYAASLGVILAFETMDTDYMNTLEKANYFVEKICSPYLKIYPDMGNLNNAYLEKGYNLNDDIFRTYKNIVAAHIKDTKPSHYRNIDFGKGLVDFDNFLKIFITHGINRFTTEFWYQGSENYLEEIKTINSLFKNKLENLYKGV